MHQVTSGGRKEEAMGEDSGVPGREVTAQSPGRGRSPAQCGTVSLHQPEPWCSSCTPRVLLPPRPAHMQRVREVTVSGHKVVWVMIQRPCTLGSHSISALYLSRRKVTWTDQSIRSIFITILFLSQRSFSKASSSCSSIYPLPSWWERHQRWSQLYRWIRFSLFYGITMR